MMKFKRQIVNQRLNLIACTNKKDKLGKNGELLYRMKKDFQWFQHLTTGHIVIMGVKTYLEIGKALPNRLNIVIYDPNRPQPKVDDTVILVRNFSEALMVSNFENTKELFVIGGASLYREAMDYQVDYIYRTFVFDDADGDVDFISFDEIQRDFTLKNPKLDVFQETNRVTGQTVSFQFEIWEKDKEEQSHEAIEWLLRERENSYESGEDDGQESNSKTV